eukprot:m.258819 g.258819  ORF g.258819 m.258819 type:complete len:137 (-) comp15548_c2_seq16:258-668(-)
MDNYCCDRSRPKSTTTTARVTQAPTTRGPAPPRDACPTGFAYDNNGWEIFCKPHDVRTAQACPSGSRCGEDSYCCLEGTTTTTRAPTTRTTTTTARYGCRRGVARDHTGADIYCARDGYACTKSSYCGPSNFCCNY